jgi:hypothetical protein
VNLSAFRGDGFRIRQHNQPKTKMAQSPKARAMNFLSLIPEYQIGRGKPARFLKIFAA